MNLMDSVLATPWGLLAIGVVLYCSGLATYRLFLHPLAKFPGPKLAAISRWYETYYDVAQGGQYTFKIAELHEKYGPIVRISPYELHVNDPDFYRELYRQEGGRWNKYAWAYDAFGVSSATICTSDHNIHRHRRAPLNTFFSKPNVVKRQSIVTSRVNKLRMRIAEFAESGTTLDIGTAVSAMTTDIATEYMLGTTYNNLNRADFNRDMANMLQGSGAIWRLTKHVRFFGPLMKSIPPSLLERSGDPKIVAFLSYLRDSTAKVKERMSSFSQREKEDLPSNLVDAILGSNLSPEEKGLQRINDETDTIVGAGLETVAAVIRLIVFYLYKDPKMVSRLRNDIQDAYNNAGAVNELTTIQLEQIPYLIAVIMEGLRLNPGIATRMARIAPDRNLTYDTWVIPQGTPVGMTTLLMHLNPTIYENPTTFNPDRWMDPKHKIEESKYFAPFSKGTRTCLGIHLATAELHAAIVMLVSTFDFELVGTLREDVDVYSDQFIAGTKSQNGVKVRATLVRDV